MNVDLNQTLYRDLVLDRAGIDDSKRTVKLAFSSEAPVSRYFGTEILSHDSRAMDMSRLRGGAPLLVNHNPDDQVGVVMADSVEIGADKKGRAEVRFGNSERAKEIYQDVKEGIRTLVSVGYRILETVSDVAADGKETIVRVTRWLPLEISLVAVPADAGVGVGRSQPSNERNMETITPPAVTPPPVAPPAPTEIQLQSQRNEGANQERSRINEITATRDRFAERCPAIVEISKRAIESGMSIDAFRAEFLRAMESAPIVAPPAKDPKIGMNARELGKFSVLRAIRQIVTSGKMEGLEKEACDAAAKHLGRSPYDGLPSNARGISFIIPEDVSQHDVRQRISDAEMNHFRSTQIAGTFSLGGATVKDSYGSMIEYLRNQTVLGKLGITMLDGLVDNVIFPVQTGGATGYWVSETGAITGSNATWAQKAMTPKRCGASIPMSLQFIAQSSLSAEAFARQELMTVLGLLTDLAGLEGTGGVQPLGVKNTSGINATVTFGGAATWADMVEFETGIVADNADIGNMAFALSAATVGKWKTILRDSVAGAGYLIGDSGLVNGYPFVRTNQITGSIAFFGHWPTLIQGLWAGTNIVVDPYGSNATNGTITVTVQQLVDFLVKQPLAFNVSTDSAAQ